MPPSHYEIIWHGIHFWVGADSPHDAQERIKAELAAEGVVAHAWQMSQVSERAIDQVDGPDSTQSL